jgi:tetratricopeptide (TPR) repeat protein
MIRHRHLASLLRILLSTAGIVSLLSFHVASAQTQPQNVSDEAARGLSLYQSGDLQGALKVLRERVKISAGDSDAWHYLGLASIKAGDFKGAREAFGMAVKLRPDFLAARTGFAYSFLLAGLLKEALREAERILEQNRQSDEAHYIISAVSLKQGNYLKALKEADAALELQPNFQAALNLKKQALFYVFTRAVIPGLLGSEERMKASLMGMQNFAGFCCFDLSAPHLQEPRARQSKSFDEAAAIYEEAIKRTPNLPEVAAWRGELETLRFWKDYFDPYKGSAKVKVTDSQDLKTPPRILSKPDPQYTEEEVKWAESKKVVLMTVLDDNGKVMHTIVLRPLSYDVTVKAFEAAKKIQFEPATKDGKPVSVVSLVEYEVRKPSGTNSP